MGRREGVNQSDAVPLCADGVLAWARDLPEVFHTPLKGAWEASTPKCKEKRWGDCLRVWLSLRAKEQEMPRQRDPGGWSCSFLSGDLVWGPGLYIWWKVFCWAPYLVCGNKARILTKTVAAIRVLVPALCFAGHFLLASGRVHPSP